MSKYKKYYCEPGDIEIKDKNAWTAANGEKIGRAIFNYWCGEFGEIENRNDRQKICGYLLQKTDGVSLAEVYEIVFYKYSNQDNWLSKFIIKVYFGDNAQQEIEDIISFTKELQASRGADYFSCEVIHTPLLEDFRDVIVYKHADSEYGENSKTVKEFTYDLIKDAGKEKSIIDRISLNQENFLVRITSNYNSGKNEESVIKSSDYLDNFSKRLASDIFVDASNRKISFYVDKKILFIRDDRGLAIPEDEMSDESDTYDDIDCIELIKRMTKGNVTKKYYIATKCYAITSNPNRNNCFEFKCSNSNIKISIKINSNHIGKITIEKGCEYKIFIPVDVLHLSVDKLRDIGFSNSSISPYDLRSKIFKKIKIDLFRGTRHPDLHCGNILIALQSHNLKLIDIDKDSDLVGAAHARLEISIWRHIADLLSEKDTEEILSNLEREIEIEYEDSSHHVWALIRILLVIRKGAKQGKSKEQLIVTYATQIFLYQRYAIEESKNIPSAFNTVSAWWINQLDQLANFNDINQQCLPVQKTNQEIENELQADDGVPTLYSLWEKALQEQDGYIMDKPEKFLNQLKINQPKLTEWKMTELQRNILNMYQKNSAANDDDYDNNIFPFQSNRNVIISAPTSSGKTTVAEMFLVGPRLLNQHKRCSIYIAPTRALTQAKHRELKEKFANTKFRIVLSTGEDSDSDGDINHNEFDIACMVYEKANILFSHNQKLLNALGCIVVDEFHMLSDLERGPILEMVLTKIISKRNEIDSRENIAPRKETVRIIAISTEDIPDKAIKDFLTTRNNKTNQDIEPLVIYASQRPVSVTHSVVIPIRESRKSYTYKKFPFVEFKKSEDRLLDIKSMRSKEEQLSRIINDDQWLSGGVFDAPNAMKSVLSNILLDILKDYPRGHRVLVFIPSRSEAEGQALHLKNILSKDKDVEKYKYRNLVALLLNSIKESDDERMAKTIEECVEYGILFHHSDISRKIRSKIEEVCSNMEVIKPSQVLFATETLSYGVNLAVHDVILFGVEFNTQTRDRNPLKSDLSVCAYHNMAGRAGRLGKRGSDRANVYIITSPDRYAFDIIKNYYVKNDRLESMFYVSDDKNKQKKAEIDFQVNPFQRKFENDYTDDDDHEECRKYKSLGASSFSYPFVRSVLDGLRHVNMSSEGKIQYSNFNELKELINNSLYTKQILQMKRNKKDVDDELQLFNCAIIRIIHDCAKSSLQLVEIQKGKPSHYKITRRGEAVIDTGTEINTIEPLLLIVENFSSAWKNYFSDFKFPVELYILCILAQDEVFKWYIRYTPEWKAENKGFWPKTLGDENRARVFDNFKKSLERILREIIQNDSNEKIILFATKIRDILDNWEPIRKENPSYFNGATDSLLRFFYGIIAWINNEKRESVNEAIEGQKELGKYGSRMQKFTQFTERLHMKILFLSKMLETSKYADNLFTAEDQRQLHFLAARLRLGCTTNAIPLFWPFSSDFRRIEAEQLISRRMTPDVLLKKSLADIVKCGINITDDKIKKLIEDLRKYIIKQFDALKLEITIVKQKDKKREAIDNILWPAMKEFFDKNVYQFCDLSTCSCENFNKIFFDVLDFSGMDDEDEYQIQHELTQPNQKKDELYRIVIDNNSEDEFFLQGENLVEEDSEDVNGKTKRYNFLKAQKIKILGVQFRRNWECCMDTRQSFADILEKNEKIRNLVVVAMPWIPLLDEQPENLKKIFEIRASMPECTTTFITPAAFAVMLTMIVRELISGKECMKMLSKKNPVGKQYNIIGIEEVQKVIDQTTDQVPPSIREKLINHFELI